MTINPPRRRLFDPTSESTSLTQNPPTLEGIANAMYRSCHDACIYKFVKFPDPSHECPHMDYNLESEVEIVTTDPLPTPLIDLPLNDLDSDNFFLTLPTYSKDQVKNLEEKTRGQHENLMWHQHRIGRITGSIIHHVNTKVKSINSNSARSKDPMPLVQRILGKNTINSNLPPLKYGRQMEPTACVSYIQHQKAKGHVNVKVQACGLFILQDRVYIGASPDGIVNCDCCGQGILEIKCPLSIAHEDPNEVGISYFVKEHGQFKLKQNHPYYSQIQCEMGVTNHKWADFVVYSPKGIFVQRISYNDDRWLQLIENAEHFFRQYVSPSLITEIVLANHIVCNNSRSSITPAEANSSTQTTTPTVQATIPSCTSTKRKRFPKKKKTEQPMYLCGTCNNECLYPEQIQQDKDNTVQCDSCQLWYHWGCVGYNGHEGEWYCNYCEMDISTQ